VSEDANKCRVLPDGTFQEVSLEEEKAESNRALKRQRSDTQGLSFLAEIATDGEEQNEHESSSSSGFRGANGNSSHDEIVIIDDD